MSHARITTEMTVEESTAILNYFRSAKLGDRQAFDMLQLQADIGNASAINYLGELYLRGIPNFIEADVLHAIELFYRAGTRNAYHNLANLIDNKTIYTKEAQYKLAMLYEERRAINDITDNKPDDEFYIMRTFENYHQSAQAGHLQALNKVRTMININGAARYHMGVFFLNGIEDILERNYSAAIKLFYQQGGDRSFQRLRTMAANGLNTEEALYSIGLLIEENRGEFDPKPSTPEERKKEAWDYFKRSAEIGYKLAIEKLASNQQVNDISIAKNRSAFLYKHRVPQSAPAAEVIPIANRP